MKPKAIILFSGGLDSTVMLALALAEGKECLALSFDYGQRHRIELKAAETIAKYYNVPQQVIQIDPSAFANTSLIGSRGAPKYKSSHEIDPHKIPSTQVPARNTLFLAYALGQSEIHHAQEIHIGPNAQDFAHYPDCRPAFYNTFQAMANHATKQAAEGNPPRILTPLIHLHKKEIVALGQSLNAPLHLTFSCYDPTPAGTPCTACLACHTRSAALS